jgi:hypothetical protein
MSLQQVTVTNYKYQHTCIGSRIETTTAKPFLCIFLEGENVVVYIFHCKYIFFVKNRIMKRFKKETCGRDQNWHLELLLVGSRAHAVPAQGSSINKSGTVEGLAKKPILSVTRQRLLLAWVHLVPLSCHVTISCD